MASAGCSSREKPDTQSDTGGESIRYNGANSDSVLHKVLLEPERYAESTAGADGPMDQMSIFDRASDVEYLLKCGRIVFSNAKVS